MKPQVAGAAEGSAAHSQTDQARDNAGAAAQQLISGQQVQARMHEAVHWTGTVETVALGVVWIREDGLGERKLLDLREYQVRHETRSAPPHRSRLVHSSLTRAQDAAFGTPDRSPVLVVTWTSSCESPDLLEVRSPPGSLARSPWELMR